MKTWIFTVSGDRYNLSSFLRLEETDFLFLVDHEPSQVHVGDRVYLWRLQEINGELPGIIASAFISESPALNRDQGHEGTYPMSSGTETIGGKWVRFRLDRIANKKEVLKQSWMSDDPVLRDLLILKTPNQNNFLLDQPQTARLAALWKNTGVDWGRAETIAALHVYERTFKESLSLKVGAPIPDTALMIGRAVKGVYNKVINFRHLDPRDKRKGFSGGGDLAGEIWNEFYDDSSGTLNRAHLIREYERHWLKSDVLDTQWECVDRASGKNEYHTYRPGPVPTATSYRIEYHDHSDWYVYLLLLGPKQAIKVGFAHDPSMRLREYNHKILTEITKVNWRMAFEFRCESAVDAHKIEQQVLQKFSKFQLPSNGEVLVGISLQEVKDAVLSLAHALNEDLCENR